MRRIIHDNEWWFSILDVIQVLSDTPQAKTYWAKMKERDKELSQPFPFWEQLKTARPNFYHPQMIFNQAINTKIDH